MMRDAGERPPVRLYGLCRWSPVVVVRRMGTGDGGFAELRRCPAELQIQMVASPRNHKNISAKLTSSAMVVVRDGKNLKGRLLGFVLGTIGRRVLEKAFENSVKAIEARNNKVERLDAGNSKLAA